MDDRALELLEQKYDCILKKLEMIETGQKELKSDIQNLKNDVVGTGSNTGSIAKDILDGIKQIFEKPQEQDEYIDILEQKSEKDDIKVQELNAPFYKKWWIIVAGGCLLVALLLSSLVYVVHKGVESPGFREYQHQVEADRQKN